MQLTIESENPSTNINEKISAMDQTEEPMLNGNIMHIDEQKKEKADTNGTIDKENVQSINENILNDDAEIHKDAGDVISSDKPAEENVVSIANKEKTGLDNTEKLEKKEKEVLDEKEKTECDENEKPELHQARIGYEEELKKDDQKDPNEDEEGLEEDGKEKLKEDDDEELKDDKDKLKEDDKEEPKFDDKDKLEEKDAEEIKEDSKENQKGDDTVAKNVLKENNKEELNEKEIKSDGKQELQSDENYKQLNNEDELKLSEQHLTKLVSPEHGQPGTEKIDDTTSNMAENTFSSFKNEETPAMVKEHEIDTAQANDLQNVEIVKPAKDRDEPMDVDDSLDEDVTQSISTLAENIVQNFDDDMADDIMDQVTTGNTDEKLDVEPNPRSNMDKDEPEITKADVTIETENISEPATSSYSVDKLKVHQDHIIDKINTMRDDQNKIEEDHERALETTVIDETNDISTRDKSIFHQDNVIDKTNTTEDGLDKMEEDHESLLETTATGKLTDTSTGDESKVHQDNTNKVNTIEDDQNKMDEDHERVLETTITGEVTDTSTSETNVHQDNINKVSTMEDDQNKMEEDHERAIVTTVTGEVTDTLTGDESKVHQDNSDKVNTTEGEQNKMEEGHESLLETTVTGELTETLAVDKSKVHHDNIIDKVNTLKDDQNKIEDQDHVLESTAKPTETSTGEKQVAQTDTAVDSDTLNATITQDGDTKAMSEHEQQESEDVKKTENVDKQSNIESAIDPVTENAIAAAEEEKKNKEEVLRMETDYSKTNELDNANSADIKKDSDSSVIRIEDDVITCDSVKESDTTINDLKAVSPIEVTKTTASAKDTLDVEKNKFIVCTSFVQQSQNEKTPEKNIEKETVRAPLIKLSNTLNILSDEEDEPQKPNEDLNKQKSEKDTIEKQSINLDDDDDIMVIEEDANKTDLKEHAQTGEAVDTVDQSLQKSDEEIEPADPKDLENKEPAVADEAEKASEKPEPARKEDLPVSEVQKTLEPVQRSKLVPDDFFKKYRKSLADMSRDEIEEFCILKIVEGIIERSTLNEIRSKLKTMAQAIEEYKKKAMMLTKQNRDLQVVLKSVQEEQKKSPGTSTIAPLKITRSVGMQVLMTDKNRRRAMVAQTGPANTKTVNQANNRNVRNGTQSPRTTPQKIANQIPVPRLVPAGTNPKVVNVQPNTNIVKPPVQNGIKNTSPALKPEKRTHSHVTVDLTDDEPPSKVASKASPVPPVRLVNQQNLLAPRQQLNQSVNSPRKVYIPISLNNAQSPSVRPGQAVMLKTVTAPGQRPRAPAPPVVRAAQTVPMRRPAQRHPAPLPDAMKQYQPPNWKALPPAPDLKLSKVENGIVISWKIEGYQEDSYEEIASYQLYAYQETSAPPSTALWKKIGDVKALPLPMACTLTQFMAGYKYYFAVRAVDIRSRLGPFSLPGSILLLNKM